MTEEKQECKCCECREKLINGLKEFTFKALIVYVGVTLAIITSANILKPKHHCPKMLMPPRPGIERQIPPPPPMVYGDFDRNFKQGEPKCLKKHRQFNKVKRHPKFNPQFMPGPVEQQPPVKPGK